MQAMKNSEDDQMLTCLLFSELSMSAHMVAQVTTIQEVHYQINVISILECISHVDYEPDVNGLRIV